MCQYYTTRYICGHRHRILELKADCYLADDHGNFYDCCEKEGNAKYAERDIPSPFHCPNCLNNRAGDAGITPADDILLIAARNQAQKKAEETDKKAQRAAEKAADRDKMWSKARNQRNFGQSRRGWKTR